MKRYRETAVREVQEETGMDCRPGYATGRSFERLATLKMSTTSIRVGGTAMRLA